MIETINSGNKTLTEESKKKGNKIYPHNRLHRDFQIVLRDSG